VARTVWDDEFAKGHTEFGATMAEHRSGHAFREAVRHARDLACALSLSNTLPVKGDAFRPRRAIVSGTARRLAVFSASVPVMSKSGLLRLSHSAPEAD